MTKKINVKFIKNPEDIFEVVSENLVSMRISRDFMINTPEGELTINKWVYSGEHEEPESDWDFLDVTDMRSHDKMSEEEQDLFDDFVSDLEVIK